MPDAPPPIPDHDIPLDVAKSIISQSIHAFSTELGCRADAILNDNKRLNLIEELDPEQPMMQYRPAGVTKSDLIASGIYDENFAQKYGPHFTQQTNEENFGILDYKYTYTKDSVLYLAHELGHAIADDIQIENGLSFRDFTANQSEEQAYFIQSIVAERMSPEFNVQSAGFERTTALDPSKTFNRQNQRLDAITAFEQSKTMPDNERSAFALKLLGGTPLSTGDTKDKIEQIPMIGSGAKAP